MDHNNSVERKQAKTKSGKLRYKLQYSRATGYYVVKPIKQDKKTTTTGMSCSLESQTAVEMVQRFHVRLFQLSLLHCN